MSRRALGRFARELRWRIWQVPVEREVDAELAFHLEMRVRELVAEGVPPEEARAAAMRRFGDVGSITSTCRDIGRRRDREMRRAEWLSELRQDVRYGMRYLRAHPGFAAVTAVTIALGIGASTTIFGIADAVVLRPLPFADPARLVRVWETNPGSDRFAVSEPNYLDWRVRARSFAALAAYRGRGVSLTSPDGDPEQLRGMAATHEMFGLLGVRPLLGRTFAAEESRPGADARVVVLSHALWRRRFGGDPGVLGRSLSLDGAAYQVIGVMPPGFEFPQRAEVWLPLAPTPASPRGDHRLGVVGRLAPGASAAGALAEMRAVGRDLARAYPESNAEWGVNLASFDEWIVGRELRSRVMVLLAAVGLLLLMACANVANLLVARASTRAREMSVRAALGAGRGRIVRQLLTESLVLAALGAALGVAFAAAAVPALRGIGADVIPRMDTLRVDWRVLAFAVAASAATGLLFGLVPALYGARADLHDVLRGGARVSAVGRLRSALVLASVAMAMLLLVGAGLVGGSFARLMRVDPGFRPEGVLAASIALPRERYATPERQTAFFTEVLRRAAALPGATGAGATSIAPFSGGNTSIPVEVVGRAPTPGGEFVQAGWRTVTPGYFAAAGIPLRRGRGIDASDVERAPRVLVISETMAARLWPREDAIGRQIRVPGDTSRWTVVGVVGDVRDQSLEQEPALAMYLSFRQVSTGQMWVLVRTAGDPSALAGALRREVWAIDRQLPVGTVEPLTRFVADIAAQPRLTMLVFALFAAAALTLAVVGVYGVVAFGVSQRTREIGVRLALGARPAGIVAAVVRQGVALAAGGVVVGLGAALALARYLGDILFGVAPTDVATYAAVALLLTACAALASLLPARAAARTSPMVAMRE